MAIRNLHDIETLERTPLALALNGVASTYALIARTAARQPKLPALSFFAHVDTHTQPKVWTYAQWLADITRTANLFRRLGIARNDVIAYALPNLPEAHLALWGGETAGIAFAVNPLLDGQSLHQLLRAANVRWLVTSGPSTDRDIWQRIEAAITSLPQLKGVLAVDPLSHLPGYVGPQTLPPTLAGYPVLDFGDELAKENGEQLNFAPPEANDIASYLCTGGTTGLPKIARHSHANELANAWQLASVVDFMAPGQTVLTALPLFHVNAQIGTGLSVFASGGHALLAPAAGYRTPDLIARFWEIIEHHRVVAFSGVPTVYAGLLQAPRAGRDLSCLSHAICGAAPMPVELFKTFERETGLHILEGYGLTEGACVSSINPADGEPRIGSIGLRMPWQAMRAMVIDGQSMRKAEVDEVGTLFISGPNVFVGYLNPAHNEGVWYDSTDADGNTQRWFNTGDLGRMDSDGYFWLTGRKKELIIRGGHNIDPKSIEEVLATHPAVAMCAAVGRPDPHAGEIPVAYVQLRPGAQASEAELLAHATAHISERAAIPKAVMILPALPVTAVGKIFKPTLSMREVENTVRAEAGQLGITLTTIDVVQDSKRGLLARYAIDSSDASALSTALGRYTFAHEAITV